jgi:hypothetical protein
LWGFIEQYGRGEQLFIQREYQNFKPHIRALSKCFSNKLILGERYSLTDYRKVEKEEL